MSASRDRAQTTDAGLDFSKIRPGDEVLIRAEFVRTDPFGCPVVKVVSGDRGEPKGAEGSVMPSAIAFHTPKPFGSGDRVKVNGDPGFIIKGQHCGVYWCVREEPRRYENAHASVLERDQ